MHLALQPIKRKQKKKLLERNGKSSLVHRTESYNVYFCVVAKGSNPTNERDLSLDLPKSFEFSQRLAPYELEQNGVQDESRQGKNAE